MANVKQDPEANGMYMDDEFYEDTGELSMPAQGNDNIWLTRIPDWLYSAVSQWDDLAEGNDNDTIQLGEVVAFATTSGIDKDRPMRLFLNDQWRAKAKLPTAYQIEPAQTTEQVLGNTYVFTEKDLPGYRSAGYGTGYSTGYGYKPPAAVQDPKSRVQKRSRYKKAIPKHTSLVGHATRQYTANPIDTKEYKDFSAARIKHAIQGTNTKTIITKEALRVLHQAHAQGQGAAEQGLACVKGGSARHAPRRLRRVPVLAYEGAQGADEAARVLPQGGLVGACPARQVWLFCKHMAASAHVQRGAQPEPATAGRRSGARRSRHRRLGRRGRDGRRRLEDGLSLF
jgi:hypothetical protein